MTLFLFKLLYCSFYGKNLQNNTVNVLKISTHCFLFLQNAYKCSFNPRTYVVEVVPEHLYETPHDKTNKMTVRPAKTEQSGHSPSLIRVFAVRSMGSY